MRQGVEGLGKKERSREAERADTWERQRRIGKGKGKDLEGKDVNGLGWSRSKSNTESYPSSVTLRYEGQVFLSYSKSWLKCVGT